MIQSVTFPLRTKSENEYRRMHWRVRARETKAQRQVVDMILRSQLTVQYAPCTVTLTRISVGELDDDNTRGAMKSVRDSVAAWLGVDDRSKSVVWRYEQEKCKRGAYRVRVAIEDYVGNGERHIEVGAK